VSTLAREAASGRALPFAQRSRRLHMNWQLSAIKSRSPQPAIGHLDDCLALATGHSQAPTLKQPFGLCVNRKIRVKLGFGDL
jgi:hypothetical protein